MVLLELYFLLDVMMILATITLTFSLNNVILLINFLSMITIVGIELSVSNIEITLLILVIYESSLLCLFLVNGILLMSSLSFNYRIFSWSLLINNWVDKISLDLYNFMIALNIWLSFRKLNSFFVLGCYSFAFALSSSLISVKELVVL